MTIRELIETTGEDADRDGLKDTPGRVTRAFAEMTSGYGQAPAAILSCVFEAEHDELVVLNGIRFTSLCEHHLLPFSGVASVGYLPNGKVVGISKLARLVECYAKRLQIQERLTSQVAEAIMTHVNARGAGVVVSAHHACMGCRGVRQPDAVMVTSSMFGVLRENAAARAEFMSLLSKGGG